MQLQRNSGFNVKATSACGARTSTKATNLQSFGECVSKQILGPIFIAYFPFSTFGSKRFTYSIPSYCTTVLHPYQTCYFCRTIDPVSWELGLIETFAGLSIRLNLGVRINWDSATRWRAGNSWQLFRFYTDLLQFSHFPWHRSLSK